MQGGGSLGAYECGVYKALSMAGSRQGGSQAGHPRPKPVFTRVYSAHRQAAGFTA